MAISRQDLLTALQNVNYDKSVVIDIYDKHPDVVKAVSEAKDNNGKPLLSDIQICDFLLNCKRIIEKKPEQITAALNNPENIDRISKMSQSENRAYVLAVASGWTLREPVEELLESNSEDEFWKSIKGREDPFAGCSLKDLKDLLDKISEFPDSDIKATYKGMLEEQFKKMDNRNTEDYLLRSSYFQYKIFERIMDNHEQNSDISKDVKYQIETAARKVIDAVDAENLTPEGAVSLKDTLGILRTVSPDNEQYKALEAKVDEQLKIFDAENGLDALQNVSAEELEARENKLHEIAEKFRANLKEQNAGTEYDEVLTNLAVQKLKVKSLEEINEQAFAEEYTDLKDQFQLQVEVERNSALADRLFMAQNNLSQEDFDKLVAEGVQTPEDKQSDLYKQFLAMRSEIANTEVPEGKPLSNEEWAKKQADSFFNGQEVSKEDYAKTYETFLADAKRAQEAVEVSHALSVDNLANRTARLVGAQDLNKGTKEFLNDFAKKHPKMYAAGKIVQQAGPQALKKMAIMQAVNAIGQYTGIGMGAIAIYSALDTYKTFNKGYKAWKEQTGQKGFKNYWKSLDKEQRLTTIGQIARTGITAAAALVSATGIGMPAAVAIRAVGNAVASSGVEALKFAHHRKEYQKAKEAGDEKAMKKYRSKKKIAGVALGIAALGGIAYHFGIFGGKGDAGNGMDDVKDNVNNTTPAPETDTNDAASVENQPEVTEVINGLDTLSQEDIDHLKSCCKMGPTPIVTKLVNMGVLKENDHTKLIGDGTQSYVISRTLSSYLGHPYDSTEVSVHANMTPEQTKELMDYLHSDQYRIDCADCNKNMNLGNTNVGAGLSNEAAIQSEEKDIIEGQINEEVNVPGDDEKQETVNTDQNVADTSSQRSMTSTVIRDKKYNGKKYGLADQALGDDNYRNAMRGGVAAHVDTGAKHTYFQITDENGNLESSGTVDINKVKYDNSGKIAELKAKIKTGGVQDKMEFINNDSLTTTKESFKNANMDVNNDGVSDKVLNKVTHTYDTDGNGTMDKSQTYTFYKDGKTGKIYMQYDETNENGQNVSQVVESSKKQMKEILDTKKIYFDPHVKGGESR